MDESMHLASQSSAAEMSLEREEKEKEPSDPQQPRYCSTRQWIPASRSPTAKSSHASMGGTLCNSSAAGAVGSPRSSVGMCSRPTSLILASPAPTGTCTLTTSAGEDTIGQPGNSKESGRNSSRIWIANNILLGEDPP